MDPWMFWKLCRLRLETYEDSKLELLHLHSAIAFTEKAHDPCQLLHNWQIHRRFLKLHYRICFYQIIRQHILGATSFPFRLLEFGEHTREKNTDLPGCRTALLPRRQPHRNTSSQLPTPAPHLSSSGLSRIHKTSNHRTPCAILQLDWRIRVSSSFRSIARYAESWELSQTIAIIEMMSSGMIKKKFQ